MMSRVFSECRGFVDVTYANLHFRFHYVVMLDCQYHFPSLYYARDLTLFRSLFTMMMMMMMMISFHGVVGHERR